jgi:alpha-ribazole phosphatase
MTRLVLCRHVQPGDRNGAESLAAALAPLALAAVYTSTLSRAVETARVVAAAHALEPVELAELREIDLGEVDGLAFDDFPADLRRGLLEQPLGVRFPGGETYEELRGRVVAALDEIVVSHPDDVVAVVSHAGAIRAALATWLRIADDAFFRIDQRFGSVNVVDWIDGVPLVRLVNGTIANGACAVYEGLGESHRFPSRLY